MNKHIFKVVVDRIDFHVAPVGDGNRTESYASHEARGKLVRYRGLEADGSLPGLLEEDARRLCHQLSRARRRNRVRLRRVG